LLTTTARWPGKAQLTGMRWSWAAFAWVSGVLGLNAAMLAWGEALPAIIAADNRATLVAVTTNLIILGLNVWGAASSIRRYRKSNQATTAYLAMCQLTLLNIAGITVLGGVARFNLWWGIQFISWVTGFTIILFGLLSETVQLLRQEQERAQEREQLLAAEEYRVAEFEATLASLRDGIILYTPDGRLSFRNQVAEHILRAIGEDFTAATVNSWTESMPVTSPEGTPLTLAGNPAYRALKGEHVEPVQMVFHGPAGPRWISARAVPIHAPLKPGLLGVVVSFSDLTPLRKAEEAQKASEARLANILENTHDSFFTLDRNWNINFANHRFGELLGIDEKSFIGRNLWEALPVFIGTIVEDNYRKVMIERIPCHFKTLGFYTSSWFDVSVYPSQDGISVFATDRTDEHKAIEALKQSEERFRQLADAMPQLVWTATPDGNVDYFNRRVQEYQGIRPVEGKTWEWSPVLHPDDQQATLKAWTHAVENAEVYQIEHRVQMADGSVRWHLSRGVPVYDEQGRVSKWYGTATDIHDLKEAEAALQKYTAALERSNRDLQNFLVTASHDLQEPLRKIEAIGDSILEMSVPLEERQADRILRMRKAARQMREMVNGLQILTRLTMEPQGFQTVDLNQVLAEVEVDLQEKIQASGGRLESEPLPVIRANKEQIRLLLFNLLENALKFQPPQGNPHVRVSARQLAPDIVQLIIEDNGIGFNEADAGHLFEPFERLVGRNQTEFPGIGIGLAICRRIVENHGGEIQARSQPGQGTRMQITLPIKAGLARKPQSDQ
ncbi:MAG TPA: PAS domain S-box protein, partial [Anaerolineaceae bacterium]|nr:PAS domain S-box protein [Anaerolineaceae bacterium]